MKDISILACFGINTDELENYYIDDSDPTSISLSVTKRKTELSCPGCGVLTSRVKDYKNKKYFYRNINGYDVNVHFHQRRYLCPTCNKTFLESNPFINNSNYKLSALKIHVILARLKEGLSLKLAAYYSGVSTSTVIKVLEEYYRPPRRTFSKIICIDEFLSFNSDKKGKYSCLLINFESGNIIDVIRSRRGPYMNEYFRGVPLEQRRTVKYIIMDMYRPYRDIAKCFLPNATVVVDPFHYIRYTVEAIDYYRIETMNKYEDTDEEYKVLKKYKTLLLMKYEPTVYKKNKIGILDDRRMSDYDLVELMLSYSKELKEAYELGHYFLKKYDNYKFNEYKDFLREIIDRYDISKLERFQEVSRTYQNWFSEICNSRLPVFNNRSLSNGPIEGRNNKIKVLKRVSYGLTNFDHLRKRIFLIFDNKRPHEK